MKPLPSLNNVERAKLLHELLPGPIKDFLEFAKGLATYTQTHKTEIAESWKEGFFSFDAWLDLAKDAEKRIDNYGYKLVKSSRLFSDQLFDGYTALWSADALLKFVDQPPFPDQNFREVVKTFFNYSERAKSTTPNFSKSLEELATSAESYIHQTIADAKKIVLDDATKANDQPKITQVTTLPGCTLSYFPISFEEVILQELEQMPEDKIVVRGYTNTHAPSRIELYLENLDRESLLYLADYVSK